MLMMLFIVFELYRVDIGLCMILMCLIVFSGGR